MNNTPPPPPPPPPPFPLIHVDLNRDPDPSPDPFFPGHDANPVYEMISARGGLHDPTLHNRDHLHGRDPPLDHHHHHHHHHHEYCSVKWMSSKMRIMKKMTTGSGIGKTTTTQKLELEMKTEILETDSSSNNSNRSSISGGIESNNPIIIRVCSDCNTTKTPLWRSGPRGPKKSLCNACGIRQRKARRAMAMAAAAANGEPPPYPIPEPAQKAAKKKKKKRPASSKNKDGEDESDAQPMKKRKRRGNKIVVHPPSDQKGLCFEEFRLRLSERISGFKGVFPQDEKEAAILLMALSYGLVQS